MSTTQKIIYLQTTWVIAPLTGYLWFTRPWLYIRFAHQIRYTYANSVRIWNIFHVWQISHVKCFNSIYFDFTYEIFTCGITCGISVIIRVQSRFPLVKNRDFLENRHRMISQLFFFQLLFKLNKMKYGRNI